jgi:AcrR family transcriptional regulator
LVYRTTQKIEKRKEAKRKKLLNVAIRLFGKFGYHKTTVPMIVNKSNSSTGSFYFYFRNKEDIFAAVLKHIDEKLSTELNNAIALYSDPLEKMRSAVIELFLFLARNSSEARILLVESSGLSSHLEQIRQEIVASHTRSVEEVISKLPASAEHGDSKVLARCWVGAAYEAARFWLEEPSEKRPNAQKVAEDVAGFNLRGLGN